MISTVLSPNPTIVAQLRTHTSSCLSGKEVMNLIGISRNAFCKWVRSGVIPAYKIGKDYRFDAAQLAVWLEARQMWDDMERMRDCARDTLAPKW
jgi:excisionase family DNA binding protein